MDYEKKYKEALERAKKYKLKEDLIITQDIFPELADSDDERIRKEIITYLSIIEDRDLVPLDDWLAWLEKQGNSPIKWNKNTKDCKPKVSHSVLMKTTHGIAEGEWQGEHWHQYRWSSIVRDSDVLFWIELSELEKQGEQKPFDYEKANIQQKDFAPKVEPKFKVGDKIYLKPEYRMPDDDTPLQNTVREITNVEDGWYKCDKGCSFNIEDQDKFELVEQKPLPPKDDNYALKASEEYRKDRESCGIKDPIMLDEIKEAYYAGATLKHKPAEWSEEDENMLESVIDVFINNTQSGSNGCIVYKDEIDWLKSLKDRVQPQPKQEWSEEDKNMINKILAVIKLYYDRDGDDLDKQSCISWLKSLRPQNKWKPSDEQLEALKNAIHIKPLENPSDNLLWGLYEQLKKLIGE